MVATCWSPAWNWIISRHALRILFGLPHEFLRHGYPTKLKVPTMAHLACIPPGHLEWKDKKLQAVAPSDDHAKNRAYRTPFMTFHMHFLTFVVVFDSCCSHWQVQVQDVLVSICTTRLIVRTCCCHLGFLVPSCCSFYRISSNCSCLKVDMRNSIVTLPATMVLLEGN